MAWLVSISYSPGGWLLLTASLVVAWQFYYAAKVLIGSHRAPGSVDLIGMSRHMEVNLVPPFLKDL